MLTVFIASRNGERTLPSVLQAYTQLQPPSSGWKLVVVDNGSTDRTHDIVASFQDKLPLTYVFEGKPGKNFALNTGLAHLEGDLAVFSDDDIYPHSDWLIRLQAAADAQLSYAIFGGAVIPRWEAEPPDWINCVPRGPVFTLSEPNWEEGPIWPTFIFGPNMAIRAEIFKAGTRFDPSIGPRGTNYAMGSETELIQRLARQGNKTWYARNAVVEHFIRLQQMNKAWVLKRAIRYGRGSFRRIKAGDPAEHPNIWKQAKRIAKALLGSDENELFSARWEFNYSVGYALEAFYLRNKDWSRTDPEALAH